MMNESVSKIVLEEVNTTVSDDQKPLLKRDMKLLGHVKVTVTVQVGHVDMNIEDLFSVKKGEVLNLAQSVDEPITLFVDNKPIAKGNLVAVDDNFGVEIIEIAK